MQVYAIIKPNSKHREGVLEVSDGNLIIYTKEPPIEGRANQAAAKLVAEHFGVSKSSVRLVRGETSKYKVFEVEK